MVICNTIWTILHSSDVAQIILGELTSEYNHIDHSRTGFDAVAVLIDDTTEAPRRAIFIRSGESGSMASVPPGRYRLRFQVGSDWLSERRFCRPHGTSEFDTPFDFEEIESNRETRYSTHEVTLHPVPGGTARTHAILNSRFGLPPP